MRKNSWNIIGNLGKDAQTAITTSGKAVANLSVAVNEGRPDTDGVWHETTQWIKVECWGPIYKYASHLRKGQAILVEGRLRVDNFTTNGKERTSVTNVARTILLLAPSDSPEIEGVSTNPEMGAAADEDDQSYEI